MGSVLWTKPGRRITSVAFLPCLRGQIIFDVLPPPCFSRSGNTSVFWEGAVKGPKSKWHKEHHTFPPPIKRRWTMETTELNRTMSASTASAWLPTFMHKIILFKGKSTTYQSPAAQRPLEASSYWTITVVGDVTSDITCLWTRSMQPLSLEPPSRDILFAKKDATDLVCTRCFLVDVY